MKSYFYLIGFVVLLMGCEKAKFSTYESGNYIQFSKTVEDSTCLSFLFFPDVDEVLIPLSVEISGFSAEKDREFTLNVDETRTTATKDKHFILPDKLQMRAGHVVDTCWLKLKRTPDMKMEDFRIVLRLDRNDFFEPGQPEYLFAIIRINDKISQPDWWDNEIVWYFLGEYSDKKYSLFIDVTGIADMGGKSEGEKRTYCLKFKYWLEGQKKSGNIVREDDENKTEMTVPVIG